MLAEVAYTDGGHDLYFVPLISDGRELRDALADGDTCAALLADVEGRREYATPGGRVWSEPTAAFPALRGADKLDATLGPATSSNSLVFFGRRLLLKVFRRLEPGTNPDYEIGRFLTERTRFDRLPRVAGVIEYHRADGERFTLGILQEAVPNQGDGWHHALTELGRYFARPDTEVGAYLHAAATLGRRTAEMHLALTSDPTDPVFAPEPLTDADTRSLTEEIQAQAAKAFPLLAAAVDRLPPELADAARQLSRDGPRLLEALTAGDAVTPTAVKTRVHGDYHLGQVLWAVNDYVVLDFEGEPTRTVAERRAKFSPVRDVAGMLRSYHYAAYAGLFAATDGCPADADRWYRDVSATFLQAYREATGDAAFLPQRDDEFDGLLNRFTLAKALYELAYELNNRPDWVRIPLSGVLELLSATGRPVGAAG